MRKIYLILIASLSSCLLLFGCGKKEEETVADPIVQPIVDVLDEVQEPEEEEEEEDDDEEEEDDDEEEERI